jgi:DNA-binding MarR family transcriptional regulator
VTPAADRRRSEPWDWPISDASTRSSTAACGWELKTVLEATQGNLSVHLKKLEEAGYVAIDKSFKDNKPLTRVSITPTGRKAFSAYLDALGGLIGGKG